MLSQHLAKRGQQENTRPDQQPRKKYIEEPRSKKDNVCEWQLDKSNIQNKRSVLLSNPT